MLSFASLGTGGESCTRTFLPSSNEGIIRGWSGGVFGGVMGCEVKAAMLS